MSDVSSVYGPWLKVNSIADAVRVSINAPKPGLVTGYWSDDMKNKMVTKKKGTQLEAGDTTYIYIKTVGIPDNTAFTITVKEWDPTYLDDDETITVFNARVQNNCIHQRVLIDKTWFADESDLVGEAYFEVESTFRINGEYETLSESYPSSSDDYMYVIDNGVLITVLIKLPHSKSTDTWERKGLGGHTGIAIGEEFYDFGPDITQYNQDNDPITGVPGVPWWDKQLLDGSNGTLKRLSDVDLPDILAHIQANIEQKVYKVEFTVTSKQAELIEKWWEDRYKNLGTYACLPWSGEQCTTTVRISLEKAGVLRPSFVQTPESFLNYLKAWAINTAGPRKSKAAKVTQIQWE